MLLAIACRGRLRLGPEAPRPGARRAGAGRHRRRRTLALRRARGIRPGRQGSRRLRQRRRPDRAARRAGGPGSGHRLGPGRVPRPGPARRTTRRATTARASWASTCSIRRRAPILGQFPHFLPASIAIGYGLDGLTGVRRVTHFWTLLGLVCVYLLGARLFGRTVAAAGTLLLAINVIEVWFSGYPERRGRRPDAAVRGDAGVVAGPGRRPRLLRRRWRPRCSACCCSCGSTW